MKRKSVLLGTKKIHYPAAGLQSDVEALLQKFVDTNSIRYEEFARLWRESNFSLIHAGRAGLREKRYFVEEAFKTIIKFIQSPFSLQVRVGALYTLYGIYHTQRMSPKVRVRVPLSCWQEVSEMHEEVRAHKHLDVDYIIRKMKHDGVFEFVAYPSSLTLEHLYNCDDDDGDDSAAVVDYNWQSEPSALTALLDEESLGQLSAVHDKYHQLKCDLNHRRGGEANTPSSSLDLIHSDVVETIVRIGQEKEAVLTSPVRGKNKQPPRSAPSDDSARERANRIREIKQRASSARANTDSSSLRISPKNLSHKQANKVDKKLKPSMRPNAVMTSCGDDALPLAANPWQAMKLSDGSMPLNPMQSALAYKQADADGAPGSTEALVNAAVLRQRLELYWSQVLQCQQQKAQQAVERERTAAAPAFPQPDPLAEARSLMQRLMTDNVATSASMPLASLVAMAKKSNASYPAFAPRSPAEFGNELGTLLPPPPLLPTSLAPPPHPLAPASDARPPATATTVQTTTSTSPLDLSKATAHDFSVATTAATLIPPILATQDEQRKPDASQPLDLSTTTKRHLSDDRTTILPDKPVLQSTPQRRIAEPQLIASGSNGMAPPVSVAVPTYSQALAANPAFSALNAQQLLALGPYLQRGLPLSFAQSAQPPPQPPQYAGAAAGIGQDYLQKWIQAAQQRQQATAVAQQPAAKKPRTEEYHAAAQMQFQRLSAPTKKDVYLGTGAQQPTALGPGAAQTQGQNGAGPNRASGKRYKRYAKPPYSYVSLITLSILSSPEKKLRLSQILKRISEMFPFFNGSYQGWRDSVRHNLSQNECFVKVLKNPYRPTAKGNYWTVNVTAIPHELLLRQNTLVSRYAQDSGFRYRKDLTEVFDLVTGNLKVGVPHYLFNGAELVDEPAAIMEALLLEEKNDDDSSNSLPVNSRVYSLEDMFNQDDFLEEDMLRQHQHHGSGGRWSSKAAKRAQNKATAAAATASPLPTQVVASSPSTASFQHYINSIESQKMALQMMQSPAPAVVASSAPMLAPQEILSKALSGQMSNLGCLPLLQNYYAKNPQSGAVASPMSNRSPKASEISPVLALAAASELAKPASPATIVADNKMEASGGDEQLGEGGNWNQNNAKRNRRKGVQPMRRYSSNDSGVKAEFTASPRATSTVDSGIVGSLSPRSPTRSFCSSEPGDLSAGPLVMDQASPVRSQSSDVSAETVASSPREHDQEELMVSPRPFVAPHFPVFAARPMETGKTMYINTSPPGASQDFSSTSSQRGVRKRAKATRRSGANRRSAEGSESEDSLVEELDVRAVSPKKNKLPSRSSKKQARQKLSKSIADYVSSDDEDPADFSDDDYDVTSDLIPKESARLGRASSARKRRKLSSQNDEPEAGPSSTSEDKPTAEIVAISTVDDGLEDGGGKKVDDSKGNKGAKAKARKSREGDAPQEVADVLPRKRAGTASKWPLPLVEAASSSSQVRESPMRQKLRKQRESRSIGPTMSNAKGEPIFKLEADSYVALKPTETERQRPAVAKVVSATDTHVVVIRYTGMYYSVWREKDENTPPEKETLHRNHVLFGDFDLTRKGMLPTKVVRILHALYAEFDE